MPPTATRRHFVEVAIMARRTVGNGSSGEPNSATRSCAGEELRLLLADPFSPPSEDVFPEPFGSTLDAVGATSGKKDRESAYFAQLKRLPADDRLAVQLALDDARTAHRASMSRSGAEQPPESIDVGSPVLNALALQGLPGEFVRLVEPHTESDPAALLGQFLVAAGNLIGRGKDGSGPYFRVEADRHYLNLYLTITGETSKGRKGTSWSHVLRVLREIDSAWARERIKSGLSSGEGYVSSVRDPVTRFGTTPQGGQILDQKAEVVDSGVPDKRLLAIETEFSSVLKRADRQGNTLSDQMRQGWDSGKLSVLTKTDPVNATHAHLSVIGHITIDELRRRLTETEQANGFANRFLWVFARRSKVLPRGGNIENVDFADFTARLARAVEWARTVGELKFDDKAGQFWDERYESLSAGKPGLFGAVIGRAEAQVIRLASVHAVLDASAKVRLEHLRAAMAFWQYCEDSARFVLGATLGDPLVDRMQAFLDGAPRGLTRTELSNALRRNYSAERIEAALLTLKKYGLADCVSDKQSGGRPAERWFSLRHHETFTRSLGSGQALRR
jgi:hypothetical protein